MWSLFFCSSFGLLQWPSCAKQADGDDAGAASGHDPKGQSFGASVQHILPNMLSICQPNDRRMTFESCIKTISGVGQALKEADS